MLIVLVLGNHYTAAETFLQLFAKRLKLFVKKLEKKKS